MKALKYFLTIVLMLVAAVAVLAQDIISAKEAASLLKNDEVVFVSARTPSDYSKVHIPGAVNIDHKSLYVENSMLDDPAAIAAIFGQNGISNSSQVLVYDDGSMQVLRKDVLDHEVYGCEGCKGH